MQSGPANAQHVLCAAGTMQLLAQISIRRCSGGCVRLPRSRPTGRHRRRRSSRRASRSPSAMPMSTLAFEIVPRSASKSNAWTRRGPLSARYIVRASGLQSSPFEVVRPSSICSVRPSTTKPIQTGSAGAIARRCPPRTGPADRTPHRSSGCPAARPRRSGAPTRRVTGGRCLDRRRAASRHRPRSARSRPRSRRAHRSERG